MTVLISPRSARRMAAVTMAIAGVSLVWADAGAGNAAGPASCMGHEASSISPPGSSTEVPGGMPQLVQFIRGAVPGPPGQFVSGVAKLHAGSHEGCDQALE